MAKKELYHYKFKYVDSSVETFVSESVFKTRLYSGENNRIKFDDTIINLDNVIKVEIKTQSQIDEESEQSAKNAEETIDALNKIF